MVASKSASLMRGMRPRWDGSWELDCPIIVYVLPEPVWWYAL